MANRLVRYVKNVDKPNYLGVLVGFFFYFLSFTPSLLPRPELYMGLIAGISFAIGYGIGVFISYLMRWLRVPEVPRAVKLRLKRIVLVVVLLLIPTFSIAASDWQNEVRILVSEEPLAGSDLLSVFVISALVAFVLLVLGRGVKRLRLFIKRLTLKVPRMPRKLATLMSTVLVIVVLGMAIDGILFRAFFSGANNLYSAANNRMEARVEKPSSPLISGSDASLVSWESLGRQGRSFVAGTTSAAAITDATAGEALEPIRVYVGMESADTIAERADLAVRELVRTGAFEREVLAVMTTTGSGWIEPEAAAALEYLHGGDTALVTMQYSFLPSWISLLADQQNATDSGKALFEAVYSHWASLPETERPKLITYGLSLGSFGMQAAFSGASDLAARTDGALFVGTPNFTEPWATFTRDRTAGSPEIKPVYGDSSIVRFSNGLRDLQQTSADWASSSKVLYVQHPSDPIVWWNPSLILNKPDWLAEPRGYDVSPRTQWYPFITFLQVTVDQFFGVDMPAGHGHDYVDSSVAAWQTVVPNTKLSGADITRLQQHINRVITGDETQQINTVTD